MRLKPGNRICIGKPLVVVEVYPDSNLVFVREATLNADEGGRMVPLKWAKAQRLAWLRANARRKIQRYKPRKSFPQRWKEAWRKARAEGSYPKEMLGEIVANWRIIAITQSGWVRVEHLADPSRRQLLRRDSVLFTGLA